MTRKHALLAAKFVLAAALFAWLIASGRISGESFATLGERWPWFVLGVASYGLVLLLAALRWRFLLDAQGLHYPFRETARLTLVGWFFNQVFPGSTGGDVAKAFFVARDHSRRRAVAILTVLFDRILGLVVLAWVAFGGMLANRDFIDRHIFGDRDVLLTGLAGAVAILIVASVGAAVMVGGIRSAPDFLRRATCNLPFRGIFGSVAESIRMYRARPLAVTAGLAVSVAIHSSVVGVHWFYFKALGVDPENMGLLFVLVPLSQLAMAVPITPGSLGTAEAAYHHLFSLAGVARGSEICLLQRLGFYVWAGVGGLVYVASKRRVPPPVLSAPVESFGLSDGKPSVPNHAP